MTGHARRFDSPLVGREHELATLRAAFATVERDRACQLLTVLGAAGVGKSRLVQEFVRERRRRRDGRCSASCLPYGEGITYWPLAEVVRDLLRTEGPRPSRRPARSPNCWKARRKRELIGELIADALGLEGAGVAVGEETFWAVRKLFEALAQRRPLVVIFDDLQWAEPTFIRLVDHIGELSRGAPILLLCMARPELFDNHPGWGGGKLHAALDAPRAAERRGLPAPDHEPPRPRAAPGRRRDADRRGGGRKRAVRRGAAGDARRRGAACVATTDQWAVTGDLRDLPVPQTINSLLAARLEGLPEDERALLVQGSVEGTLFHSGALRELAPESSGPPSTGSSRRSSAAT